eukprot:5970888-Prymnesium_polylepis.1
MLLGVVSRRRVVDALEQEAERLARLVLRVELVDGPARIHDGRPSGVVDVGRLALAVALCAVHNADPGFALRGGRVRSGGGGDELDGCSDVLQILEEVLE